MTDITAKDIRERLGEQYAQVLDRAMNTWDPKEQPAWLSVLSDEVDKMLRKAPRPPGVLVFPPQVSFQVFKDGTPDTQNWTLEVIASAPPKETPALFPGPGCEFPPEDDGNNDGS